MTHPYYYFPKELSWLAFNERVLQEAADAKNPIVERMRFLGIYSNNMDEFYRVKVADVKRQILLHLHNEDHEKANDAKVLMEQIQAKVRILTANFEKVNHQVVRGLARYNIFLINAHDLNEYQHKWCVDYFKNKVLRHIAPILVDKKVDLSLRIKDALTYLFVSIDLEHKHTRYACIEVPTDSMSRFVVIPPQKSRKKKYIIFHSVTIFTVYKDLELI